MGLRGMFRERTPGELLRLRHAVRSADQSPRHVRDETEKKKEERRGNEGMMIIPSSGLKGA